MHCYVNWNGGAWFVKEANFFEMQKKQDPSGWHTHWRPIYDVDGIEHARDKARMIWGEKGERWHSNHKGQFFDERQTSSIEGGSAAKADARFEAWMESDPLYSMRPRSAMCVRDDMRVAFEAGLKEARDGMASRLIDQWAAINNKQVPWRIAVGIVSVIGKLPADETQRLLDLDKV